MRDTQHELLKKGWHFLLDCNSRIFKSLQYMCPYVVLQKAST